MGCISCDLGFLNPIDELSVLRGIRSGCQFAKFFWGNLAKVAMGGDDRRGC